MKQSNYVKRSAHITSQGSLYVNILSYVENLLSATNTTEESIDSILQAILPLYSVALKYSFTNMGRKISYFTNLKKRTVALDNERGWVKDIIE